MENQPLHESRFIEDLELRSRTYGVLKRAGINQVAELLLLSLHDLKQFRNMSAKDLQLLLEALIPSWNGYILSVQKEEGYMTMPLHELIQILCA